MATGRRRNPRQQWDELYDHARIVFTPHQPISSRELFIGRSEQITKIVDAVRNPGAHAIVFGERGVGKTSLVTVLPMLLEVLGLAGFVTSKIQCDGSDNYASICRKLLGNLIVTENEVVIPARQQQKLPLPDTLDLWLNADPTPDEFRRLILTLGGRHLIGVIDEFDAVAHKVDDTKLIANTIKALSDSMVPATLILVGISDTVEQLIAEHASIDRCLVEISMPRMSRAEIKVLAQKGFELLKMTIDSDAIEHILRIVQGLPSYAHLLCREAAFVAIEHRTMVVNKQHVVAALQRSLGLVPGILIQDWERATASPKADNKFKQVLLACALAPKNDLGFFTAKAVQDPFNAITGGDYGIGGYGGSLHLLTEPKRASILQKRGSSHRWRYRFRNPLMEPYIVMYGLNGKLVTEDIVQRFRVY